MESCADQPESEIRLQVPVGSKMTILPSVNVEILPACEHRNSRVQEKIKSFL